MQPDINQEIYGLPEYLAALNAAWLNESATLFRRKYYHNGSHAGFIMYVTDTLPDGGYVDDIREAMKNSKAGQLPQPLCLCARRQERRHADHPG